MDIQEPCGVSFLCRCNQPENICDEDGRREGVYQKT